LTGLDQVWDIRIDETFDDFTPFRFIGESSLDLFTEITEKIDKPGVLLTERSLDTFSDASGEHRTFSVRRDGNLEISSTDDGRSDEATEVWGIDDIAQDPSLLGFGKDLMVDFLIVRCADNKETPPKIAAGIATTFYSDFPGSDDLLKRRS